MSVKFGKLPLLGIDISDTFIQIASLNKNKHKNTYQLEDYSRIGLPEKAIIKNEIQDVEAVADCLTSALSLGRITAKQGAIALADSLVISKIISLELGFSAAEEEEYVMCEASKHIPYPLDEVCIDYRLVTKSQKISALKKIVFFAASRAITVNKYLQVLTKAKITPKFVDVESLVMHNACVNFIDEFKKANRVAVIDIGMVRTTIIIYEYGLPVFTRTELVDMEFINKKLLINPDELLQIPSNMIAYEKFKQQLLQYLKHALQFYTSTSTGTIEKIILTGAIAKLKNLDKFFKETTNYEVIVADPVSRLTFGDRVDFNIALKTSSGLMLAIGLALRNFD